MFQLPRSISTFFWLCIDGVQIIFLCIRAIFSLESEHMAFLETWPWRKNLWFRILHTFFLPVFFFNFNPRVYTGTECEYFYHLCQ